MNELVLFLLLLAYLAFFFKASAPQENWRQGDHLLGLLETATTRSPVGTGS